jgi:hypothetical protein
VIDAIKIPEYAREYCDSWGNLRLEPLTTLDQSRNGDFIQITVYEAAMGYFYGYQLKLKKKIHQKKANIKDTPHETEEKARRAARDELLSFVSEKKLMKTFIMFDKICYDQPELF